MPLTEIEKLDAVELADEVGTREAGRRLGIPPNSITRWRKKLRFVDVLDNQDHHDRFTDEQKAAAVARVKGGESMRAIAKELGTNHRTIGWWVNDKSKDD